MIEKRLNPRRLTSNKIIAIAKFGGIRAIGKLINVSAGGGACLYFPQGFYIKKHDLFEVIFAISINNDNIYKLHFKDAIVIHVTNGMIGVVIGPREQRQK